MTDEHLDRMVRDADPYRPHVIGHLDEAAQNLLEDVVSVPALEPVAQPADKRARARRGMMSGLAGASVAATILAAALVVSTMKGDQPELRPAAPPVSSEATDQAGDTPRLLINQPGWKATTVYKSAEKAGTARFSNGERDLEMNWYPAAQYDDYHKDRLQVSYPEPVTVDGWPGDVFRYSASDFAVMLSPRDGIFVELRTGGTWTRNEFDRVIADVVRVDTRTWLAALPADIITPERVNEQAAKILADVPLPPGFNIAALNDLGSNDPYQFGAKVTSRVGCGWIAEWLRANQAGDAAALQRAADALRSSHNWQVLHQMNDRGDWPEVFWQVADEVAAGQGTAGYKGALGCE